MWTRPPAAERWNSHGSATLRDRSRLPPLPHDLPRLPPCTGRAHNGPSPSPPDHRLAPPPPGKNYITVYTVPKTLSLSPSLPFLHVCVCVCFEAILLCVGKRTREERFRTPTKCELLLLLRYTLLRVRYVMFRDELPSFWKLYIYIYRVD